MSPAGRPEIGPAINIRLPVDLLAAIDARAERRGYSRAQFIRLLLDDAMQSDIGYSS